PDNVCCSVFEVKHSTAVHPGQVRHLVNEENLKRTEYRYGKITRRAVIYRGNSFVDENGIEYINTEEYLLGLGKKERDV
ncbi:MAG: ATP-binding protein, partial [Bullifex sp.]